MVQNAPHKPHYVSIEIRKSYSGGKGQPKKSVTCLIYNKVGWIYGSMVNGKQMLFVRVAEHLGWQI